MKNTGHAYEFDCADCNSSHASFDRFGVHTRLHRVFCSIVRCSYTNFPHYSLLVHAVVYRSSMITEPSDASPAHVVRVILIMHSAAMGCPALDSLDIHFFDMVF